MNFPDTIYALSTGALPSGIAIVRLSGSGVRSAFDSLAGGTPPDRVARYCAFVDRESGLIDRGIALYFPAPGSVTGEDCGEFHLHGGRAVVAAMLSALSRLPQFRMAEAGEFSRRAFLNGKMDLTSVEGLADLISADTEAQRRLALDNSGGLVRDLYLGWRAQMTTIRAHIEADLDFSDQEDVPGMVNPSLLNDMDRLAGEISAHIGRYRRAEIIRGGFRVVILGRPNAGKSSLLNALAMRDAAIVSAEAGTTRDLVEVALDVDGHKVIVTDTAGLRDDPGAIEEMGIDRAVRAAREADAILRVTDPSDPGQISVPEGPPILDVASKADLSPPRGPMSRTSIRVSAHTGEGIEVLLNRIRDMARSETGNVGEVLPFRARHVEQLQACAEHLLRARDAADEEVSAEEMRLASNALGAIVGLVGAEEVLGEIFSAFCIGK